MGHNSGGGEEARVDPTHELSLSGRRGSFRNTGPADGPRAYEGSAKRAYDETVRVRRSLLLAISVTVLVVSGCGSAHRRAQTRSVSLHVGQTTTTVRTGDRITCRGGRHSIAVTVSPLGGSYRSRGITHTPFLTVEVVQHSDGFAWAECRSR
jgi:hypothetical protein